MRMTDEREEALAAELAEGVKAATQQHRARQKEHDRAHPPQAMFVMIPVAKVKAANPNARIAVLLYLWMLEAMKREPKRGFSYVELERWYGVQRDAARKALKQLARRGLVSVDWHYGTKPRVTVRED